LARVGRRSRAPSAGGAGPPASRRHRRRECAG
jgi:hypothetical protein